MQVHIFRGSGRVFGFTTQSSGENIPSPFAPWAAFKSVEMRQDEPMPGVDVDDCLRDLAAHGIHVTDAHARITEEAIQLQMHAGSNCVQVRASAQPGAQADGYAAA